MVCSVEDFCGAKDDNRLGDLVLSNIYADEEDEEDGAKVDLS